MQTNLAKFLNESFKYIIVFCISFIWCNFYYHNFLGCIIASIIISSLVCYFLSKIFYKKNEKKELKNKKNKEAQNAITQLLFYNKESLNHYFYSVFKFSHECAIKSKNGIIINNTMVVPIFSPELLVSEYLETYKIFKLTENKKLIILTNKISDELTNFLSNFESMNIQILDGEEVYYKIIEPAKKLPENLVKFKSAKKLKLNQLVEIAFNRKNAKGYFVSGLFVMFASLFYSFSLYYQICGSLLFAFSLFSFYNKTFNKTNTNVLFE